MEEFQGRISISLRELFYFCCSIFLLFQQGSVNSQDVNPTSAFPAANSTTTPITLGNQNNPNNPSNPNNPNTNESQNISPQLPPLTLQQQQQLQQQLFLLQQQQQRQQTQQVQQPLQSQIQPQTQQNQPYQSNQQILPNLQGQNLNGVQPPTSSSPQFSVPSGQGFRRGSIPLPNSPIQQNNNGQVTSPSAPALAPAAPLPFKPSEIKTVTSDDKLLFKKIKELKRYKKVYAILETSLGDIKIKLYNHWTPRTVLNFIELAEGKIPFRDIKTKQMTTGHFYDGLLFHRVMPNYFIQTGDPLNNGRGGPGFEFKDEFHPSCKHNKPGIVSMANSGPNTNGSQFFITLKPLPEYDYDSPQNFLKKRGNTVFGFVVNGMDVVRKISEVPRDNFDKPFENVVLKRITINRISRKK